MIVGVNVKYHSNHEMQDQYIVKNASKNTNRNKVDLVMVEDQVMVDDQVAEDQVMVDDQVAEDQVMVEIQETMDQKKCLMQPVGIVERNVKYHSSQEAISLFTVENVFRIINQNSVVDLVMVEDQVTVEDQVAEDQVMVEVQEEAEIEKCLLQPVVTVERNVKYHLGQEKADLFIVTNVSMITKISKDCLEFHLVSSVLSHNIQPDE